MGKAILKKIDFIIYLLVGPFVVLYVFPQFLINLERQYFQSVEVPYSVRTAGAVIMYIGATLALWCTLVMWLNRRNSPNVFDKPSKVVVAGPYKYVRHPMMWSLFITLFGEIIVYMSPALSLWLLIWIRFSVLYIDRYEEPYLTTLLGEDYKTYCQQTPRWLPRMTKTAIAKT